MILQPVMLNRDPLPWVSRVKHLGNLLQSDNSMSLDISQKRGKFIGKVNSLMQEFHYADPEIQTKLINVYATSFYGAGTWDIFSKGCEKLYKSWNVTIRQVFGLDWATHRYLIEHVSGCLHPQVMLSSRLVSFHKSLVNSKKFPVRFLARMNEKDMRTVLGRNLNDIIMKCGQSNLENLSANLVKKSCRYRQVPEEESWRLPLITDLLSVRRGHLRLEKFLVEEIEDMIHHICTS